MQRRDLLKGLLAIPAAVVACATKREPEPKPEPALWLDAQDSRNATRYPLDRWAEDPALLHHGARFDPPPCAHVGWTWNMDSTVARCQWCGELMYDKQRNIKHPRFIARRAGRFEDSQRLSTKEETDKWFVKVWLEEYCRG